MVKPFVNLPNCTLYQVLSEGKCYKTENRSITVAVHLIDILCHVFVD